MIEIVKSITVDVAKLNTFKAVVAKQGDIASRFLKVQLVNEGVPMSISSEATVTINALRSDNEAKAFLGTVNSDGSVTVPLTGWMLEIDGELKCSISVAIGEQDRLTSTSFIVIVEYAEFDNSTIYHDESIDIMMKLLDAAENEEERIANETERTENESVRENSESARVSAEQSRTTAETARANAEASRESAFEEAVAEAEEATENANNAAQQAASVVLAGGFIPIHDEDTGKDYNIQIVVRQGYPILTMVEATTN